MEKLINLPRVPELTGSRAGIWAPAVWPSYLNLVIVLPCLSIGSRLGSDLLLRRRPAPTHLLLLARNLVSLVGENWQSRAAASGLQTCFTWPTEYFNIYFLFLSQKCIYSKCQTILKMFMKNSSFLRLALFPGFWSPEVAILNFWASFHSFLLPYISIINTTFLVLSILGIIYWFPTMKCFFFSQPNQK